MSAHPTSPATSDAGFTLVEVLVSLFIFSLISVAGFIALSATLDARERSEARLDEIAPLVAMRRLMADDIAAITPRTNRDGLGGIIRTEEVAYTPGTLPLTRRARPNPGGEAARGDLQRIEWRVQDGQLIRAFLPHENPALVEPPRERVVLDGVESMRVEVLFASGRRITATNPNFTAPHRAAHIAQQQGSQSVALDVLLTHVDGTTTRHVFPVPSLG